MKGKEPNREPETDSSGTAGTAMPVRNREPRTCRTEPSSRFRACLVRGMEPSVLLLFRLRGNPFFCHIYRPETCLDLVEQQHSRAFKIQHRGHPGHGEANSHAPPALFPPLRPCLPGPGAEACGSTNFSISGSENAKIDPPPRPSPHPALQESRETK